MDIKYQYRTLKNYNSVKENFFVSYAVRGPMVIPSMGLEAGLPCNHPIPGPVSEPSPLNNRCMYSKPWPTNFF
jgi:hypothetical protein